MVERCGIDESKHVLVVGCGVGTTPCYLAKKYGCSVVGVDLSEGMIEKAKERAKREQVEDRVKFMPADAQNLPFENDLFDIAICESVLAFVGDKQLAINEYTRVTKPGGHVGINEVTWLEPPPPGLARYMTRTMGAEFLALNDWRQLLENSGIKDIVARAYQTNALSQWIDEVKQFKVLDFLKAWYRVFTLFMTNSACRKFTIAALALPKSIFRLFRYFGYGIYAGRK
ncbi:class I SAM-dependent methyltransferase [Chloroflexota bacterium]